MNDVTCVTPGCCWMYSSIAVAVDFGLANVRPCRQEDVDHELRPRRRREEALRDVAEAVERRDERDDRRGPITVPRQRSESASSRR